MDSLANHFLESTSYPVSRQPIHGSTAGVKFCSVMGTKKPKYVSQEVREILAANIRERMDKIFFSAPDKPMALAKRVNCSKSTIQRALSGEVGLSADAISQIAGGLRCEPWQLMKPPSSN